MAFDRDNRGGGKGFGKRRFGGSGFGNDRSQGRPFMHKATCAKCGNECEVPFKPVAGRPVYCNNCFKRDDAGAPNKFGGNNDRPRFDAPRPFNKGPINAAPQHDNQYKEQFAALNAKLDKILFTLATATVVETDTDDEMVVPMVVEKPKKIKASIGSVKTNAKKKKKAKK